MSARSAVKPGEALSGASGTDDRDAISILIVDDQRLLSESLALALRVEGLTCEVPELSTAKALLAAVTRAQPDLVLLDLDLGSIGSGVDLIPDLVSQGCRVVVMSASTNSEELAGCLDRGATGLLRKDVPFPRLVQAVLTASQGNEAISPSEKFRLHERARRDRMRRTEHLAPFDLLSESEAEVLRMIAEGSSVRSIAQTRYVSQATVRTQVRAILTKLHVGSQLEAVALGHRAGWL